MINIHAFEDFGQLEETECKVVNWINCKNNSIICEDSLQRTLDFITKKSFAILSAYRKTHKDSHKPFSKQENIERNRKLRNIFNNKKLGVHQLDGHWQEKQASGKVIDSIERSYIVIKPDNMTDKEFCDLIIACLTIDNETQDGALVCFRSKSDSAYFIDANKDMYEIGKHITLGDKAKLAQAYSQHVKKMNVPFKFDGEEVPQTNIGEQIYQLNGFCHS